MRRTIKGFYVYALNYVGLAFIWFAVLFFGIFLSFGVATSAAFYTSNRLRDPDATVPIVKTTLRGMKRTWMPATALFCMTVLLGGGLLFIHMYLWQNEPFGFMNVAVFVSALYLLFFNLYGYPIIATFNHSGPLHFIKNTLLMIHLHPLVSLKLLGSFLCIIALVYWVHFSTIIIGMGFFFFLQAFHLGPLFDSYLKSIKS